MGVAWERDASPHWTYTGELYWHDAEAADAAGVSGFNLGFFRPLRRAKGDKDASIDLLFAAGRTFSSTPSLTLYVGPRFNFTKFR